MRLLHFYRPRLPSTRAQDVQVLQTCHALAMAKYDVSLFANAGENTPTVWKQMGLDHHPKLTLRMAPFRHPGLSGLWFRHEVAQWWRGSPGVILARDTRRLLSAVQRHGKGDHRIILETHGLESLNHPERRDALQVEKACLRIVDGIVANCQGTLDAWTSNHHVDLPTVVAHNGTHTHPIPSIEPDNFLLVLGSMRDIKGTDTLLKAVAKLPFELRWVGGSPEEHQRFSTPDNVKLLAPINHGDIGAMLASARVLIAPLGDNVFSHQMTSPMKLWDYLATNRPIVTADTACTAEIATMSGCSFHVYDYSNEASILQAIENAWHSPVRSPFRREWSERIREMLPILKAPVHA